MLKKIVTSVLVLAIAQTALIAQKLAPLPMNNKEWSDS